MKFLYLYITLVFGQINSRTESQESQNNQEYDTHIVDNQEEQQDVNWGPLFYFIGLFIVVVVYLNSKSQTPLQIAEETMQQKMTKFVQGKGLTTKDTINRLTQVMTLFETHNLKLSYKQFDKWFTQETVNINININIDVLVLNIVGNDTNGRWQLNGSILINKDNQIVCLLNKVYENAYQLQGGDLLYYAGVYKDLKFTGNWYYEKSGYKGEWEGLFQ